MRDQVAVEAMPLRPRKTPNQLRDTPAPIVIDHRQIVATIKQHFEIAAEPVSEAS